MKRQVILGVIVEVWHQWLFAWTCAVELIKCKEGEFLDEKRQMCVSCFSCTKQFMKQGANSTCAKNIWECGQCINGYEKKSNGYCDPVIPSLITEAHNWTTAVDDLRDGGLSTGAIVGIVTPLCLVAIGICTIIIILHRCNLLPGQKRWCLRGHEPSDLYVESEKGTAHTPECHSLLDSDAEKSSQLSSTEPSLSHLSSVGPSPHNPSQVYSQSVADTTSVHYQLSLQSSGGGSHLPLQAQSIGSSSPILAQPDPSLPSSTQPTPDSSQSPYPVQDSSGGSSSHETQPKISGCMLLSL